MGGFASLGSGSRGNGTLVAIGDAIFLVDCGFNRKQAEQRLARLEMSPGDITAILVSHEHSDHIAGVAGLSHRYAIPVYASHGTLKNSPQDFQCNAFDGDAPFEVEGVLVNPVRVPHDAREPTQFVLSQTTANATSKIGVLSDLGSVTPHVVKQFEDCTHLLLEANHDRNILSTRKRPQGALAEIEVPYRLRINATLCCIALDNAINPLAANTARAECIHSNIPRA